MAHTREALTGPVADADLRLLRIFRKVVECGGFAAAEVELNISRSAISMAMSDLEARLALRLCQRGRSGFALTDEGAEVYEATLQLLAATEDFRTWVNSLHSRLQGELNIGITDNLVTMPEMRITNALSGLKERGPDVHINIRMMPPNEIEIAVLDGRLHTGVVPAIKPRPGLVYRSLYEEWSCLYCAANHPLFNAGSVTEADLAQYDAIVPAYPQPPEIKAHHEPLRATASATDREGIAFLILSGRYIGYLPSHYAATWMRDERLRAVDPQVFSYVTRFSAITRRGASPNLVLESYLEELEKLEGERPAPSGKS